MGSVDLRHFGSSSQGQMENSGMGYSKGICSVSTQDGLKQGK